MIQHQHFGVPEYNVTGKAEEQDCWWSILPPMSGSRVWL